MTTFPRLPRRRERAGGLWGKTETLSEGEEMGRGFGIIRGRKCPKIQLCPTCGQMRVHHRNGLYQCDVPTAVTEVLRRFKAANGARWKSVLCEHWQKACADVSDIDERALLQQARNIIGPRRLYKIKL